MDRRSARRAPTRLRFTLSRSTLHPKPPRKTKNAKGSPIRDWKEWPPRRKMEPGSNVCVMNPKSDFNVRWSRGEQVLRDPARNKDLAFTREERRRLGIVAAELN